MSQRKWLRRTIACIAFAVGIVVTAAAGILFPYFVAGWVSSIPILVTSAVIAVAAIGWASAWISARIWSSQTGRGLRR
jgi:hypothetical protein